jgi:hypothetical protein
MKNAQGSIVRMLVALCIVFVIAYAYFYFVATTTGADDLFNCKAAVTSIVSAVHIPESISSPGQPAVFCNKEADGLLLRPVEHIRIYGVVDPKEQAAVLNAIEKVPAKINARRIVVEFYERENWKTWSDASTGNRGGERGPETPIRRSLIAPR